MSKTYKDQYKYLKKNDLEIPEDLKKKPKKKKPKAVPEFGDYPFI